MFWTEATRRKLDSWWKVDGRCLCLLSWTSPDSGALNSLLDTTSEAANTSNTCLFDVANGILYIDAQACPWKHCGYPSLTLSELIDDVLPALEFDLAAYSTRLENCHTRSFRQLKSACPKTATAYPATVRADYATRGSFKPIVSQPTDTAPKMTLQSHIGSKTVPGYFFPPDVPATSFETLSALGKQHSTDGIHFDKDVAVLACASYMAPQHLI